MAELIELIFGTEATFGLSYIMLKGNLGIFKKKRYFSLDHCPKLWTYKISQLHVDRLKSVVNLVGRSV